VESIRGDVMMPAIAGVMGGGGNGGGGYTPLDLAGTIEWYDDSLSPLFTDYDGLLPAVNEGDKVARQNNLILSESSRYLLSETTLDETKPTLEIASSPFEEQVLNFNSGSLTKNVLTSVNQGVPVGPFTHFWCAYCFMTPVVRSVSSYLSRTTTPQNSFFRVYGSNSSLYSLQSYFKSNYSINLSMPVGILTPCAVVIAIRTDDVTGIRIGEVWLNGVLHSTTDVYYTHYHTYSIKGGMGGGSFPHKGYLPSFANGSDNLTLEEILNLSNYFTSRAVLG